MSKMKIKVLPARGILKTNYGALFNEGEPLYETRIEIGQPDGKTSMEIVS